jgi:hypothetical protein
VNCTKNHHANVGMSSPYNQWSYPNMSCPYQKHLILDSDTTYQKIYDILCSDRRYQTIYDI